MLILALLLPLLLGWLTVRAMLPAAGLRPHWAARTFEFSLGAGFGMGFASSLHFLLLLLGLSSARVGIGVEIVLLGVAAWLAYSRRGQSPEVIEPATAFRWNWVLALALCAGTILFVLSLITAAHANPMGDWDAWSVWNLRAKVLASSGEWWQNAYSPVLEKIHPYYPLLLSGFVARGWRYSGEFSAAAPIAAALLFQLAAMGLLVSAAALLRSASAGLLAGLVLLASSGFLGQGARQYADVPLSLFMLAALVLLLWAATFERSRNVALPLAGAFGAFAAWTKNEGLLFFGIWMVVLLAVEWRGADGRQSLGTCLRVAVGSLPVMLLVLGFKFFLAPGAPPFLSGSVSETAGRLVDGGRYVKILAAYAEEAIGLGSGWTHPVLLLAVLAFALRFGADPRQRRWAALTGLTLALLLAAFFATFVVTPLPLDWLLGTSLDRLYAQVWPSVLLLAFVLLRRPEDTAIVEAAKTETRTRKEKKRG